MIEIGRTQTLRVEKEDESGFYLVCEDSQEVFMPGTLASKGTKPSDNVEVFVFVDSKGDALATASLPFAQKDEFACLQVKDVTDFGAFLDMGLPKDLLVPNSHQQHNMQVGQTHLVRVLQDEKTSQLFGTEKIKPFIETQDVKLSAKQEVSVIPYYKTPLGYKVLVDKTYQGMIFHNETIIKIELGQSYKGTVKAIQKEGKVDVILRKVGKEGALSNADSLLNHIEKAGGSIPLTDKSSPEEIRQVLGMSKKSFKVAVGNLYKRRLIEVAPDAIKQIRG